MAYIPPHKRTSKDSERSRPTPESLVPHFKRNVTLSSNKIVYANNAISKWLAFGLDDDNQLPSNVDLEPVSVEYVGERPLMLVNSNVIENNEVEGKRWLSISENVLPDLLCSFEIWKADLERKDLEEVMKPTFVARIGKIHFRGSALVSLESVRGNQVTETTLRNLKRSFCTNVHASYMEKILHEVVPKIGLDFEGKKDIYHVKLSHSRRPTAIISCKCSLREGEAKLELKKVELNQERYMVEDISCLNKNLDLRLMLCTRRILTSLTEGEMNCIKNLIDSAVLDPGIKGGLRWPMGKSSHGYGDNKCTVVGVWHTIATTYQSPSLRLKLRTADRFDFRRATGESTSEVTLKLKGIASGLQGQKGETTSISDMLKDDLKLIWDNFLDHEMKE
ncbi:hypothetical protein SLEP1_g19282 [Rubroshorea leprosula]|nr:hypothetical protein SLEP1_g19282 [Rubroshorea leprosula]